MKMIAGLGILIIAAGFATSQTGIAEPAPELKIVASTDKEKGHIIFRWTVISFGTVETEVTVLQKNGERIKMNVTEKVPVMVNHEELIETAKARIITPNGKQVPIDDVWKRLKKGSVVAVSCDGKTPPQAYLRALNVETLVIVPDANKK